MNYERLKELRKHIAKSRRFDYAVWCEVKNYKELYDKGESSGTCPPETLNAKHCGTVGCVAGHAVALLGGPRQRMKTNIWETARKLLRLNMEDAGFLFYGDKGYGMPVIQQLEGATKKDALKRLDVLIATQKAK